MANLHKTLFTVAMAMIKPSGGSLHNAQLCASKNPNFVNKLGKLCSEHTFH